MNSGRFCQDDGEGDGISAESWARVKEGRDDGTVKSAIESNQNGGTVNENGDESGLRVEVISIVHHSRRRSR